MGGGEHFKNFFVKEEKKPNGPQRKQGARRKQSQKTKKSQRPHSEGFQKKSGKKNRHGKPRSIYTPKKQKKEETKVPTGEEMAAKERGGKQRRHQGTRSKKALEKSSFQTEKNSGGEPTKTAMTKENYGTGEGNNALNDQSSSRDERSRGRFRSKHRTKKICNKRKGWGAGEKQSKISLETSAKERGMGWKEKRQVGKKKAGATARRGPQLTKGKNWTRNGGRLMNRVEVAQLVGSQ